MRCCDKDLAEISHGASLVEIAILVRVQRIWFAIERDGRSSDAVGEASDDRAIMAIAAYIVGTGVIGEVGKALYDVSRGPVAARYINGNDHPSIIGDAHAHASVSYTHLRAHETPEHLVCRL